MNTYAVLIVVFLLARYLLDLVSDLLNLRHLEERLPAAFEGWYDRESYGRSQRYLRDTTRFGMVRDTFSTLLLLAFLLSGGLALADRLVRSTGAGPVISGLLFFGLVLGAAHLLHLPFRLFDTFVLEQRYGFNRTAPRTFLSDEFKTILLVAVLGGPLLALVQWLFLRAGPAAWIPVWGAVALFQLLLLLAAPVLLMPLFNRFEPLPEGPLRSAIEDYARGQRFRMSGVYAMDGSKRSSRSNAFFTGLGRSRRIVLFDTLLGKHGISELRAIIAHEMGHYRKGHLLQALGRSLLSTALLLWLLSRFLESPGLVAAFGVAEPSVHAGLFLFGFLYTPLAKAIALVEQAVSRRNEYQADAFAARTTGEPEALIDALKRLAVENLSNLTPHPFTVFTSYSHPPLLDRIAALSPSVRKLPEDLPGAAQDSRGDATPGPGGN